MSVVALQPSRFVEDLEIAVLLNDQLFAEAAAQCEESYSGDSVYWDGNLDFARAGEIEKIGIDVRPLQDGRIFLSGAWADEDPRLQAVFDAFPSEAFSNAVDESGRLCTLLCWHINVSE